LNSPTNESVGPIFTLYTSNDVVLRKKLLFKAKNKKKFDSIIRKIREKNYNGAYGENFLKF